MFNQIKEIAEGYINDALPEKLLNENLLKLASKRKEVCNKCVLNIDNKCDSSLQAKAIIDFDYHGEQRYKDKEYFGCNCPLNKKQKSLNSQCPIGKWENLKIIN